MMLLSDEAGISKSRVVRELATYLERLASVLVGAADPGVQTMPFQPIVQAICTSLGRLSDTPMAWGARSQHANDPESTPKLGHTPSRIWLAEVSQALPELRALLPNLSSLRPVEADQLPLQPSEALCQLFLYMASGSTTSALVLR
jgi:predicted ATPase